MGRSRALLGTFLHSHPEVWDQIFPARPAVTRALARILTDEGGPLLDVGCATGTLCAELAARGFDVEGVDLTPAFIDFARRKAPGVRFSVGDMTALRVRRRFGVLTCLGSTLMYATTNEALLSTLRGFRRALRPGGLLILDVVNAVSLISPRRFEARTVRRHRVDGRPATATILHAVDHAKQTFTETVSWQVGPVHRTEKPIALRLLFPQELAFFLGAAGFGELSFRGGFDRGEARRLDGPRLVVLSRAGR